MSNNSEPSFAQAKNHHYQKAYAQSNDILFTLLPYSGDASILGFIALNFYNKKSYQTHKLTSIKPFKKITKIPLS